MTKKALASIFITAGLLFSSQHSIAQGSPSFVDVELDQVVGPFSNPSGQTQILFEDTFDGGDVRALRVFFSDYNLPGASFIRVTAEADNETIDLTRANLEPYGDSVGNFNGDRVTISLHVAAGAVDASMTISHLQTLPETARTIDRDPEEADRALCDNDDNRAPASNAAIGRPTQGPGNGFCTAFLIDIGGGNDRPLLTAGHCLEDFDPVGVDFDIPMSNDDCSVVVPPLRKQFMIDMDITPQSMVGAIGDDWGVFRLLPNQKTGLTAYQEQGTALTLAEAPLPDSGTARVTGYGIDGSDTDNGDADSCGCDSMDAAGTRNRVLQTDTGVLLDRDPVLRYRVDTCSGNSGSPIFDVSTGSVIGIHTNAGCGGTATTANQGTPITNPNLVNAIEQVSPNELLALVIDRTGSMNVGGPPDRCEAARQRAFMRIEDFSAMHPDGRVGVWTFSGSSVPALTSGFVTPDEAIEAVMNMAGCSGSTPLADALCLAIEELVDTRGQGIQGQLDFLTDGEENNSSGVCAGPPSLSAMAPYDVGSWHNRAYQAAIDAMIVVNVDFYGSTVRNSGVDVETGQVRGAGLDDVTFFTELAQSTGGSFRFFDDTELRGVPTLSTWGLILFVGGLVSLALFYQVKRRRQQI